MLLSALPPSDVRLPDDASHTASWNFLVRIVATRTWLEKTFASPVIGTSDGGWAFTAPPVIPGEWADVIIGVTPPLIARPAT